MGGLRAFEPFDGVVAISKEKEVHGETVARRLFRARAGSSATERRCYRTWRPISPASECMSVYSKKTSESPSRILERAVSYFGPGGLGLTSQSIDEGTAVFEGGGGHVGITVCPKDGKAEIELETREWDIQVREFLTEL